MKAGQPAQALRMAIPISNGLSERATSEELSVLLLEVRTKGERVISRSYLRLGCLPRAIYWTALALIHRHEHTVAERQAGQ